MLIQIHKHFYPVCLILSYLDQKDIIRYQCLSKRFYNKIMPRYNWNVTWYLNDGPAFYAVKNGNLYSLALKDMDLNHDVFKLQWEDKQEKVDLDSKESSKFLFFNQNQSQDSKPKLNPLMDYKSYWNILIENLIPKYEKINLHHVYDNKLLLIKNNSTGKFIKLLLIKDLSVLYEQQDVKIRSYIVDLPGTVKTMTSYDYKYTNHTNQFTSSTFCKKGSRYLYIFLNVSFNRNLTLRFDIESNSWDRIQHPSNIFPTDAGFIKDNCLHSLSMQNELMAQFSLSDQNQDWQIQPLMNKSILSTPGQQNFLNRYYLNPSVVVYANRIFIFCKTVKTGFNKLIYEVNDNVIDSPYQLKLSDKFGNGHIIVNQSKVIILGEYHVHMVDINTGKINVGQKRGKFYI